MATQRKRNRILASIAALLGLGASSQLDMGLGRPGPSSYATPGAFGRRRPGGKRKSQGRRRGRGRR